MRTSEIVVLVACAGLFCFFLVMFFRGMDQENKRLGVGRYSRRR